MDDLPRTLMEAESIVLSNGLDFRSPKLLAQPGSIIDCLNREIIDSIGLKRIDGFEPYDGRTSPHMDSYFYLENDTYAGTLATDFPVGSLLVIEGSTNIFGKVVATSSSGGTHRIIYARINRDFEPTPGQNVNVLGASDDFAATGGVLLGTALEASAATAVATINTYSSLLRGDITALPSTPIGLHWYRDRLYAVTNDRLLYFTSGGTTEIETNYYIKGATSNTIARVLAVQVTSGTWAGGDVVGSIQYELISGSGFSGTEVLQYDESTSFSSPISSDVANHASSGTSTLDYASLWQSRTEQQAQDESSTAGWSRIDHGWKFTYENGFSDTGEFIKVERSRTNNFDYDSGSEVGSYSGVLSGLNLVGSSFATYSSGSGFTLTVVNGDAGWKTNASATVYADGDAVETAIASDDSNYVYASIHYGGNGYAFFSNRLVGSHPTGKLGCGDQGIIAPDSTLYAKPTLGAEVFDDDFYTTNARAPIVLKDFSAIAAAIPEGSIITGIQVTPHYDSQNYIESVWFPPGRNASITQNNLDWIEGKLSWAAALCRYTDISEAELLGSVQYASISYETTAGDYATGTSEASGSTPGVGDKHKMNAVLTDQSTNIGGSSNSFGVSNLSRTTIIDPDVAIALYATLTGTADYPLTPTMQNFQTTDNVSEYVNGNLRLKIDRVVVTFYYTEPSARYFIGEATPGPVCSVDVVYYVNTDGSLSSRTGEGIMHINNLTPLVSDKRTIRATDTMHLTQADAAAGTNKVADIATDMEYAGFPGLAAINAANSRYQFITANFYAVDDWDGFYGVSGASQAFAYSAFDPGTGSVTSFVSPIYTEIADAEAIAEDKPRHIAFYHNTLALGYRAGKVNLSVSGDPFNFSGVDGAVTLGVGDRVTGLLPLVGTTLGVFCENSIHGLNGTDPQSFDPQVLVPKLGAIEYTVVDMGIPVFCTSNGISTLGQSQQQGNFLGRRLSYPVATWIIPRMRTGDTLFSTANGVGIICAIPIRAKNQYRLFFKDGYVLNMTMNADQSPAFTFSKYYVDQDTVTDDSQFLVPIAWSSEIDNKGQERVHVSHYSSLSAADTNYVYELEKGWGFAGKSIPEYYTVNWYYKDPFVYKNVRKMRIDGLTKGVGTFNINTSSDYSLNFNSTSVSISIPSTSFASLKEDFTPASSIKDIADRGRAISFKVEADRDDTDSPTPPDIHQVLILQYPSGGKHDG